MIGTKFYVILLGFYILMSNYRPEFNFEPFLIFMLMCTAIEIVLTIFDSRNLLKWHRECPHCGKVWKANRKNKKLED